jgi:hypothetical protein
MTLNGKGPVHEAALEQIGNIVKVDHREGSGAVANSAFDRGRVKTRLFDCR